MKPVLIVSLDFELFWGMQDCCSLEVYQDHILGGKAAIPRLLELFNKYSIHATWATVGMIFAKNKQDIEQYAPIIEDRPTYKNRVLSSYRCLKTKTLDEHQDCFFAPDLIHLIKKSEGQEIGSHTFSHFYCREEGQTVEQFKEDLLAAKRIADTRDVELSSIVLPRNQSEEAYNQTLQELGFTSYRDEENDWIHSIKFKPLMRALRLLDVYLPLTGQGGYQPRIEEGVVNLMGSRMYKPYFKPLGFLEGLKIHRIKKQMLHAAKHGLVFHLWWHPHNIGVMTDYHLKQLDEIFNYYAKLRDTYGMRSLNMNEAAMEVLNDQ